MAKSRNKASLDMSAKSMWSYSRVISRRKCGHLRASQWGQGAVRSRGEGQTPRAVPRSRSLFASASCWRDEESSPHGPGGFGFYVARRQGSGRISL
eukprot:6073728-Pyramimonas_sp.AAC.1